MRWHPIKDAGASVAKPTADPVDLVCVTIEGIAHHQEDPRRSEALHLVGYCLGS
jgi:hypothetical protein